jgi:hypothetical protein
MRGEESDGDERRVAAPPAAEEGIRSISQIAEIDWSTGV